MDVVLASADPDRHCVPNPSTRQKAAIAGKVYFLHIYPKLLAYLVNIYEFSLGNFGMIMQSTQEAKKIFRFYSSNHKVSKLL